MSYEYRKLFKTQAAQALWASGKTAAVPQHVRIFVPKPHMACPMLMDHASCDQVAMPFSKIKVGMNNCSDFWLNTN